MVRCAYYRQFHLRAIFLGLVCLCLLSACSSTSPNCRDQLSLEWVQPTLIAKDIEVLTSAAFAGRKSGTQGSILSQNYLVDRFQQAGLLPWQGQYRHAFEFEYQFRSRNGTNIIGYIPAQEANAPWRLVIAHYDHLGQKGSRYYPGADDNASGVAAMLQLAQRFHQQSRSKVNLLFVAIDAEELGLFGSKALVKQLSIPIKNQIQLVLNLDMIGNPGRRYRLYVEGARNFSQFDLIKTQISNGNGLCIRNGQPNPVGTSAIRTNWLQASDHYAFHLAGIPWLYFGVPAHNHYHQTSDTLATLDIYFLAGVTEASFKVLSLPDHLLLN